MIGPTAEDMPYEFKEDTSTSREGIEYIYREAARILKNPPS